MADDHHFGDAEAKPVLNTDEVDEELPPEHPDLKEDDEDLAASF